MVEIKFSGLLLALAFIVTAACSSSKLTPANYEGAQIHFGQGGGFTGNVSYYVLLDNGSLFQKQLLDSAYTHEATWKKKFTKQIFSNYDELNLDALAHSEPGNLYYFVEMHEDGKVHRLVWGNPGFTPSQKLVDFYNILYKSTTSRS